MKHLINIIAKINRTDAGAPEWILLFAAGWGQLADGVRYFVDETSLSMIQTIADQRGNDLHFDYEHASLEKKPSPAAGWIKELKWTDAGIMARVEWTDKAADFIAAREYRYFSPVFAVRKTDSRVCYLDSVALTNRPKTTNLKPILARLDTEPNQPPEDNHPTDKGGLMDRKQLIAALGLADDATDADILLAVAKLGITVPEEKEPETKEVIPQTVKAALGLKADDTETMVVASIHALNQNAAAGVSAEQFKALQDKIADRDATDAVAAAMAIGKVAPAQKDWAMQYAKDNLDGFKLYVAKAPQVVPVDTLKIKKDPPADAETDDAVMAVAKLMDVSKEDLRKYGGIPAE